LRDPEKRTIGSVWISFVNTSQAEALDRAAHRFHKRCMRLDRFDLNLLVAPNALIEDGGVTRAAGRLNLSRPAMSSALKRLREAFEPRVMSWSRCRAPCRSPGSMSARGDRRRIDVVASSFTSVPWPLPGTQRIVLVRERLAHAFVDKLPLAIKPPPLVIPSMRATMQYHRTRGQDGSLAGLRQRLIHQAGVAGSGQA
jgi:hypothetical protein